MTFQEPLVSKVSCLVSVSARSCLGLVLTFCSKSWSRLGLVVPKSRLGLGLEDFGRDSSSVMYTAFMQFFILLVTRVVNLGPVYTIPGSGFPGILDL